MPRLIAVALTVALVMAASGTASAAETPEKAIEEYLTGIAQADVALVLEASAVDERTNGYQLEQMVDFLGMFHPGAPGPVHDPFFADIARAVTTGQLLSQTRSLAYGLLAPETLDEVVSQFEPVIGVDEAWALDVLAELDTTRQSSLEVLDIATPALHLQNMDSVRESFADNAERFGADEQVELAALLEFEGDLYEIGFIVLRYGDEWKVGDQVGALAAFVQWGAPRPTTMEAWKELTSE